MHKIKILFMHTFYYKYIFVIQYILRERQYLKKKNADGTYTYKNNCKVYAKVSSTVYLYNKPNTRTVWTSVDLKQRQLFDLD